MTRRALGLFAISATLAVAAVLILALPGVAFAAPARTEMVSLANAAPGSQDIGGDSLQCDVTPDGRFVVFSSDSQALAGSDTNIWRDIYLRDRLTGLTERISWGRTPLGAKTQTNGDSVSPSISDDGRYVAFSSDASNILAIGDTNLTRDVFVYDRLKGTSTRASVGNQGQQGNGVSDYPEISGDGSVVAFESTATNLTPLNDTNMSYDVFVRDLKANTTNWVSLRADGGVPSSVSRSVTISRDGRYVAFMSAAQLVLDDTNGFADIYRYDRVLGDLLLVSVSFDEEIANGNSDYPNISANGGHVAFESIATNLTVSDANDGTRDIYVRDIGSGYTWTAGQFNAACYEPSIDDQGNRVAFHSSASNVVPGDTNGKGDVYLKRQGAPPSRMSEPTGGGEADGHSGAARIVTGAAAVVYQSTATNLVSTPTLETSAQFDIFMTSEYLEGSLGDQSGGVTFDRWVTGFSSAYSGSSYVYSPWAGSSLEIKFSGTSAYWYGPRQPNYGKADVYLDGVYQTTVSQYAPVASAKIRDFIWGVGGLADGIHTLRIRVTGTKDPASGGTIVVFDDLTGNCDVLMETRARTDEQGAHATFSGTWVKAKNPTYVNSGYAYSSWAGTGYRATFYGTSVTWVGPMSTSYGKANVYIDGALKGTVDCYSSATGWRYKIWESAILTRGSHYVEIRPTHTKRAASTNYVVVVDALDVTP